MKDKETAINPAGFGDVCYACANSIVEGQPFRLRVLDGAMTGQRRHGHCPDKVKEEPVDGG
jgi:hypothetical protein